MHRKLGTKEGEDITLRSLEMNFPTPKRERQHFCFHSHQEFAPKPNHRQSNHTHRKQTKQNKRVREGGINLSGCARVRCSLVDLIIGQFFSTSNRAADPMRVESCTVSLLSRFFISYLKTSFCLSSNSYLFVLHIN